MPEMQRDDGEAGGIGDHGCNQKYVNKIKHCIILIHIINETFILYKSFLHYEIIVIEYKFLNKKKLDTHGRN